MRLKCLCSKHKRKARYKPLHLQDKDEGRFSEVLCASAMQYPLALLLYPSISCVLQLDQCTLFGMSSAPAARSNFTTSVCPFHAAKNKAEDPSCVKKLIIILTSV